MNEFPIRCEVCTTIVPMIFNAVTSRAEPTSRYWDEERKITFCGAQHSLNYYNGVKNDVEN
jgi:hypothetical protein